MHLPGFSPGHPLLVQSLELGPLGGSPTPGGQRLSGGHRASGKHGATLICKPSQASLSGMVVRVIGGCPRRATHHLSQHTLPTREVLLDPTVGTAGPREGRRVGQRRQTPAWVFLRVPGGTKAPGRLPLPGLHIQQVAAPVAPLCPLTSPPVSPAQAWPQHLLPGWLQDAPPPAPIGNQRDQEPANPPCGTSLLPQEKACKV